MPEHSKKPIKIIYILICDVFILITLEITARVLRIVTPVEKYGWNFVKDPYLPYKQKTNSIISSRSSTDEFNYVYEYNSLGFRDSEHDLTKADNVFRIPGLGDSFTYGIRASYLGNTYIYLKKDRGRISTLILPKDCPNSVWNTAFFL
jgi:hypothetical protein